MYIKVFYSVSRQSRFVSRVFFARTSIMRVKKINSLKHTVLWSVRVEKLQYVSLSYPQLGF